MKCKWKCSCNCWHPPVMDLGNGQKHKLDCIPDGGGKDYVCVYAMYIGYYPEITLSGDGKSQRFPKSGCAQIWVSQNNRGGQGIRGKIGDPQTVYLNGQRPIIHFPHYESYVIASATRKCVLELAPYYIYPNDSQRFPNPHIVRQNYGGGGSSGNSEGGTEIINCCDVAGIVVDLFQGKTPRKLAKCI